MGSGFLKIFKAHPNIACKGPIARVVKRNQKTLEDDSFRFKLKGFETNNNKLGHIPEENCQASLTEHAVTLRRRIQLESVAGT